MRAIEILHQLPDITDDPDDWRWMPLNSVSVIRVSGADAQSFLQAQFSNDIDSLAPGRTQLNAYCNPKGRVLALPRVINAGEDLCMLVDSGIAPEFLQRLKMFVMRAKVTFDTEEQPQAIGIWGVPPEVENTFPIGQPDQGDLRHIALCTEDMVQSLPAERETDVKLWRILDIFFGIPQVFAATREAFIPQNLNLDLVDGVSFRKGCYPGQEIVARVKYLGRAKQRLIAGTVCAQNPPVAGEEIHVSGHAPKKVGTVVDAVEMTPGRVCISAVVPHPIETALAVGSAEGPVIDVADLPYEIT